MIANEFYHHIYELRKPKNSMESSVYIAGVVYLDWKQYKHFKICTPLGISNIMKLILAICSVT